VTKEVKKIFTGFSTEVKKGEKAKN